MRQCALSDRAYHENGRLAINRRLQGVSTDGCNKQVFREKLSLLHGCFFFVCWSNGELWWIL